MTTRETIETYLAALGAGDGWESLLSHDVEFTSHGTPSKHLVGRDAYLESTRAFPGGRRRSTNEERCLGGRPITGN